MDKDIFIGSWKQLHSQVKEWRGKLTAITLGIILIATGFWYPPRSLAFTQAEGYSIRFFGNGKDDIDRIKIPLQPQKPINTGSTDFTIEWWMKANPGDNTSTVRCNQNDGWIYGNILFDRDVWGAGDYGDFGIALNMGKIAFGINNGAGGNTLCGSINTADGGWHHIAVTREVGSGALAIFVDGYLNATGTGPAGNIRYREGRSTQYADDPFLVIGAEKHDAGPEYPSFKGWVDELRVSSSIRYRGNFTLPNAPYVPDGSTLALLHFDEGPAGPCSGESLDATGKNNAFCQYGGTTNLGPVYVQDNPFITDPAATGTTTITLIPVSTATLAPTVAFTPLPTNTPVRTSTPTRTPLPSLTPTRTQTPLLTLTPTKTRTPTRTPTVSSTNNPTATQTRTPTRTSSPTQTSSALGADDFNRSDSTDLGARWIERAGDLRISSLALRNAGTSIDNIATYYSNPSTNVQSTVSMSFSSSVGTMSVGVRLGSFSGGIPNTGYVAELSSSGLVILWRADNWAQLGSYQITGYQSNQLVVLSLRSSGTAISVDINGVTRINVTNSAFSSGVVGLWSYTPSVANQHIFDNFSMVNLD